MILDANLLSEVFRPSPSAIVLESLDTQAEMLYGILLEANDSRMFTNSGMFTMSRIWLES